MDNNYKITYPLVDNTKLELLNYITNNNLQDKVYIVGMDVSFVTKANYDY